MKSTDVRSASDGDDACWRATGGLGGGLALASRLRSSSFSSSKVNEKKGKGLKHVAVSCHTAGRSVLNPPKIQFLCQRKSSLPSAGPTVSILIGVFNYNLT